MKKIILAIAAIAIIAQTSIAQKTNKLHLGLKVGTNLSNVYDSKTDKFTADSKFGLAFGGFLSVPLGDVIGIQPEVMFSQKGFKGNGTLLGGLYGFKRTTSYIEIPLLLAIKPAEFITVLAGPQVSFLLKQTDEFENTVISVEQEQFFQKDNLRKNSLGVQGGIDLNFHPMVIGLRAGWDFQNNNGDGTSTTPQYKNSWIQATVGFRFI